MKIVLISDTHDRHSFLSLPAGDILIHAGDMSSRGTISQISAFSSWMKDQPFKHKILIAGNHDFLFESDPSFARSMLDPSIIYLQNESVEVEGIKIWGSPVTPWFYNWAFNVSRGEAIKKYWDSIPEDTDIIVTHGPVHGLLDKTNSGQNAGCESLYQRVNEVKPKLHVSGHIHEGKGYYRNSHDTLLVNASSLNARYEVDNVVICVEVDSDGVWRPVEYHYR